MATLPFMPLVPEAVAQAVTDTPMSPVQSMSSAAVSETPGTLRNDGTMSTTPATVLDTLPQQEGFGLNKDSVAQLQAIARTSAAESQQHSSALSALDKLSSSGNIPVMYHVLATLAALSGNFGPAIAIQEQKRKAAIGRDMVPVTSQVNRLKALGKYDEATQLLEDAATRVGPQAPEIVPILGKLASDIGTKQIQLSQEKTLWSIVDEQMPKDAPDRRAVNAWGKGLQGGMLLGPEGVGLIMSKLSPHIQRIGNQISRTSLLGGPTQYETAPALFDPASLPSLVASRIQGLTGASLDAITNTMNTGAPLIANGKVLSKDELQQQIATLQREQGQMEIGGKVPLTPEYNAALLRVPGMTPERIATRNILPHESEAARLEQQNTAELLATAPIEAANRTDVTKIAGVGYTVLDVNVDSPGFGRRQGLITNSQLQANPDFHAVPEKLVTEKIEPALRASDGFNYLRRMYESMATPDINGQSGYSRWFSGAKTTLEQYLGISLSDGTPAETVMRLIVDRSVEQLEATQTVNNEVVQRTKRQLIGAFADPPSALRAVDVMQERIRSDLSRYMLKNGDNISQLLQQSSVTGPTTASYKGFYDAIVGTEGSKDSDVSPKGAIGKHQVMPATAAKYLKQLNLEADDLSVPSVNRKVAKMHMADLEALYPGRPDLAAAAYFSGSGNVDMQKGVIIDPTKSDGNMTTQQYVDNVMKKMKSGQAASTLAPVVSPTVYSGRLKGLPKGGILVP
jgi:hypothetical protein